jgi:nucleoside 2-deoxyribosyltransferase
MKKRIYLAGAMTGMKHEDVARERARIKSLFDKNMFEIVDPLDGFNIDEPYLYTDRAVVSSNKYRIDRCDIVLAMLDSQRVSIGTVSEILYAKNKGKFVIGVAPAGWAKHPWITEHIDVSVKTVDDAIEHIKLFL